MNHPAQVDNPFGKQMVAASNNAVAAAESDRAVQEVQASMIIAKKFPRDSMKALDRIINACTRPTLAETALYSYPRGGQEVTGPSIRLAEALAQEWGNIQFGIRELSSANGASTVEAFAWDMETNTRQVKVFQVGHQRYSRSGGLQELKDPRDIYEIIANQGARRLRACILGVIPGDVTETAVKQCEVTQASTIEVTPDAIKKMVDAFGGYGVTKELIEKRLGRHADAINAPQMLNLRKIYQSMKDGMSKASDWFDIDAADAPVGAKTSDLNAELAPKKRPAKRAASDAPPPPVVDDEADDQALRDLEQQAAPQPALTYAGVATLLNKADSPATLQEALQAMAEFIGIDGNEKFKDELGQLYRARLKELKAIADEKKQ